MPKFEATVGTQQELHHRISQIVDNLKKLDKEKITLLTINTRFDALEAHWKSFRVTHTALVSVKIDENKDHTYFANDYYALCEEAYFANKDLLMRIINTNINTNNELLMLRQNLSSASEDSSESLA